MPIKVLFLAADPDGRDARLRADRELRDLVRAVEGAAGNEVQVAFEPAVRRTELQQSVLRHRPQVVHFAGHGGPGESIVFDDGESVTAGALVRLFAAVRGVRLVVLNACDTMEMAEALSQVVDYAIGMSQPIHDDAAAVFSSAFYGALAHGMDVRTAFALALAELELQGRAPPTLPRLCVRQGHDPRPLKCDEAPPETDPRPECAGQVVRIETAVADTILVEHVGEPSASDAQRVDVERVQARDIEVRRR